MPNRAFTLVGLTVTLIVGCDARIRCGDFVYDPDERRCVCPAGTEEVCIGEEACQCVAPSDGGVDASVSLPTAPGVEITPAEPRTGDDLVARVVAPGADPLGADLSYEFRWTRDGVDAGSSTDRVSSEATSRGERWTVEVTTVAADGRRGATGSASVEILNTAPDLRSVGLSSYRPVEGDTLVALPSGARDADGDVVSIQYRWRAGTVELPSTTSQLLLSGGRLTHGATVSVEAVASDGELQSPPVSAGPAVVLRNTTRWIQHWPDRASIDFAIWDERHGRVLMQTNGYDAGSWQLWEHLPNEDRFVQLRPTGDGPRNVNFSAFGWDHGRARLLVLQVLDDRLVVFALDVSRRGSEIWRELPIVGADAFAGKRLGLALFVDEGTDRALFAATNDEQSHELWSLSLSEPTLSVDRLASDQPVEALARAWVRAPDGRSVYVLGGSLGASDRVHRIDLENATMGLQETGSRLSVPVALAAAASHGAVALFGYGFDPAENASGDAWFLNLANFSITPAPPLRRAVGRALGALAYDGDSERFLVVHGQRALFEYELSAISASSDAVSELHVFGSTAPTPVYAATAGNVGTRMVSFGGADRERSPTAELWTLGFADPTSSRAFARFTPLVVTPDPVAGEPIARYGAVLQSSGETFAFFGGRTDSVSFADSTTWELRGSQWVARELDASSTPPPLLSDGVFSDQNVCFGHLAVFGGVTPEGATGALRVMECSSPTSSCSWRTMSGSGASPSARSNTALYVADSRYLTVIGGEPRRAVLDAYEYDCVTSEWRAVAIEGQVPPGLSGHTVSGPRGVLFGGRTSTGYSNELYRVSRTAGPLRFTSIVPASDGDAQPLGRSQHLAVLDRSDTLGSRERLFVWGGTRGSAVGGVARVLGDLWELRIVD